jgi:hypothetical protein
MRRTMFMLVVTGTTLALAAGVALAQATTDAGSNTQAIEFFLDKEDPRYQCVGETIHFTGLLHSTDVVTEDATGGVHVVSHWNLIDVQGTGLVSGGQYRLRGTLNGTSRDESGGYTTVQTDEFSSQVIGQGQLPDFRSHFLLHHTINANGDSTAEVFVDTVQCRNTNQ